MITQYSIKYDNIIYEHYLLKLFILTCHASYFSHTSLDGIVETLLADMKGRGLSEHIPVARDLLEFEIEK